VTGLLTSAGLAAQSGGPPGETERVLAKVGEASLTVAEFEREWTRVARSAPGTSPIDELRRQLLEEMIGFRLRAAAARAAGLDRDPEIVASFERALVRRLDEQWVESHRADLTVTDEELAAAYAARQEDYRMPERSRAALIWIAAAKGSDRKAARRRAEQALDEARKLPPAPPDFGALAVAYSEERASRYQGGDIGWLAAGDATRWPAEVVAAIFALETPGALSPLVETAEGYYLIRLVAREMSCPRPLESVRDGLRGELLREKHEALRATQRAALAATYPVFVDEALFERLEPIAVRPPSLPGER
jgi:peptidyl-prolyl cis-trans isomerase C